MMKNEMNTVENVSPSSIAFSNHLHRRPKTPVTVRILVSFEFLFHVFFLQVKQQSEANM